MESDPSVMFTSDQVAVRAIMWVGFGFPTPPRRQARDHLMTMTARLKRLQSTRAAGESVTVTVVEPHLVYHDGEQRSGVLHDVPAVTAEYWERHGWVTIDQPKPSTKVTE